MRHFLLIIALAMASAPQAQASSAATPILPGVDSAEQRQSLRKLLTCIAKVRPNWVQQTLAHPYLSKAQEQSAAEALSGDDQCQGNGDVELTVRTSSIVANLAEMELRSDLGRVDGNRLAATLNTLPPMNASEDFALCVASRDPASARALALSEFASNAETRAAETLGRYVPECVGKGEQLTVDMQALRALISVALYRAARAALAHR